jgi:hypothetical protein
MKWRGGHGISIGTLEELTRGFNFDDCAVNILKRLTSVGIFGAELARGWQEFFAILYDMDLRCYYMTKQLRVVILI